MTERSYCPFCGHDLTDLDEPAFCSACGEEFPSTARSVTDSENRKAESEEEKMRRKLAELATSDRATGPVYAEKYRRDYGEEPEEAL